MKGNFLATCFISAAVGILLINSGIRAIGTSAPAHPPTVAASVNSPLAAAYLAAVTEINFNLAQKTAACLGCNVFEQLHEARAVSADEDVIRL